MKPYQWLAWLATAMLVGSAILAAWNVYPLYVYAFMIANTTWALVGWLWREWSLVVMNLILTGIYVVGIIF